MLVYLDPTTAEGVLAQLRSLASAGTRLVLSARTRSADSSTADLRQQRRQQFDTTVAALGEPALFGDTDVQAMLARTGWDVSFPSDVARRIGFIAATPA